MRKNSCSLLFASLLLTLTGAHAQPYGWSLLTNSPSVSRHDDVFFINETTGWTASGRDGIYKTIDGGVNWTKVLTNTATHFRAIGFASAMRGWAGNLGPGSYDGNVTNTNVLYQTFNGGTNWSVVPGLNQSGMKGFCSIHVLDPQHIYGGGRVRGPAHFAKSVDGGNNWTVTNLTAAGVMGGIMDVYFKDTTNGFVVGMSTENYATNCLTPYYGRIARTTNGGASWFPVATTAISCCYFWKMSWPTPDIGYVSLQQNVTSDTNLNNALIYYKTVDGGATWVSNGIPYTAISPTIPSSSDGFYWQGVAFVSANEGWAGGDGATAPYSDNFLHTTDGGMTWTPVGYNDSRRINRIRFLGPAFGVASGSRVHVYHSPLAITNQPQSQQAIGGDNVSLTVGVTGEPPFKYQWRKDGVSLTGKTNATLTLTNVVRAQTGNYAVGVTNNVAGLLSSNALLRVLVPQSLLTPTLLPGGGVHLLFGDSDGAPLTSNYLANFTVHASSNLVHWTVLSNALSLTNGLMLLVDPVVYPQRFYRVVEY